MLESGVFLFAQHVDEELSHNGLLKNFQFIHDRPLLISSLNTVQLKQLDQLDMGNAFPESWLHNNFVQNGNNCSGVIRGSKSIPELHQPLLR
jgi:hypothetical protein